MQILNNHIVNKLFIRVFGLNLIIAFFIIKTGICQNTETIDSLAIHAEIETVDTVNLKIHSPKKATLFSLVLPGLGQAYNKKYWKIPLVYAGFGVLYYFIKFNNKEYKEFRDAYYHSLTNVDSLPPINKYEEQYNTESLLSAKNYYRRNRDLCYILTGVWYLLNVVDAAVDAHLFTWEVDENLTLKLQPAIYEGLIGSRPNGGIKFTLQF